MSRLPPMPREPEILLVNETFLSVQGESTQAGRPCFFIRLTGCHLRCGYCDTEYAFFEGGRRSIDELLEEVKAAGVPLVQITGGEPLLQKPVYDLMEKLVAEGYEVMVETSGSIDASRIPVAVRRIFDIKTPGSGEADANRWDLFNADSLRPGDEVKFVLCDRDDYEWAREQVRARFTGLATPLLFSPSFGQLDPRRLAEWILEDRLPVRFQTQLHKSLWGEKRGV